MAAINPSLLFPPQAQQQSEPMDGFVEALMKIQQFREMRRQHEETVRHNLQAETINRESIAAENERAQASLRWQQMKDLEAQNIRLANETDKVMPLLMSGREGEAIAQIQGAVPGASMEMVDVQPPPVQAPPAAVQPQAAPIEPPPVDPSQIPFGPPPPPVEPPPAAQPDQVMESKRRLARIYGMRMGPGGQPERYLQKEFDPAEMAGQQRKIAREALDSFVDSVYENTDQMVQKAARETYDAFVGATRGKGEIGPDLKTLGGWSKDIRTFFQGQLGKLRSENTAKSNLAAVMAERRTVKDWDIVNKIGNDLLDSAASTTDWGKGQSQHLAMMELSDVVARMKSNPELDAQDWAAADGIIAKMVTGGGGQSLSDKDIRIFAWQAGMGKFEQGLEGLRKWLTGTYSQEQKDKLAKFVSLAKQALDDRRNSYATKQLDAITQRGGFTSQEAKEASVKDLMARAQSSPFWEALRPEQQEDFKKKLSESFMSSGAIRGSSSRSARISGSVPAKGQGKARQDEDVDENDPEAERKKAGL